MNNKIILSKLTFINMLSRLDDTYSILINNRSRLAPWFWWANDKITPNKFRFGLFLSLYLLDTKRKEISHKFNKSKLYDEQFFVLNDNNICGMIGLDNIDETQKKAEVWGFVAKERTVHGTADLSIKLLENYCLQNKGLKSLYAKTNTKNKSIAMAAQRNHYELKKIEYGVPTSPGNPKIADIMTWEKQLIR